MAGMDYDQLASEATLYNSIYLCKESAFCGRLSCGGVIELCKAIMNDQVRSGLAVVRPPGHHAEREKAMGFCLYNNVAVAAKFIQKEYGPRRTLIVDWDIHHGMYSFAWLLSSYNLDKY